MSRRRGGGSDGIALEVEEELRAHIEMRTADNERAGMDPDEARRAAEQTFGDYARIRRASLYQRTAPPDPNDDRGLGRRLAGALDTLRQDVLHALRAFTRNPALYGTAALTLAIGMGATTSIYGLANWMLLRPVPGVEKPEDLTLIWTGRTMPEGAFRVSMLSTPNFDDVARRLITTTGLTGFQRSGVSVVRDTGVATGMTAAAVTPTYFDVLGVRPVLGRGFADDDETAAADGRVTVISHALWASMFANDPEVLGETLRINGTVYTVIGVAPEGFQGTERFEGIDLWVPGATYAQLNHAEEPTRYAQRDRGWFYMLVARRAPGATWEQVAGELDTLAAWLAEEYPEDNENFTVAGFRVWGTFGTPPMGVDLLRQTLALLMGVSALVLLIASANVANLLLLRGLGRRSEVALRKALGGSWRRLMRQHLTEGLVLWLIGGIGGLALARLLARAFEGTRVGYATVSGVTLDSRVVVFAAGSALLVGAVFAVLPAAAMLRADAGSALRGRTATAGRRLWVRGGLTALQLGATLTLLVGALLLVQTLRNLAVVDTGFAADGVYVAQASTREMGYSQEATFEYYAEFERRLRLQPGITEVAVAGQIPLQCCGFGNRVYPSGADPEQSTIDADVVTLVSPTFFDLFDIPVLRGRTFTRDEVTPPGAAPRRVIIVSATLAKRLFGTIDVVGRSVQFPSRNNDGPEHEIVGVVGDVYYRDLSSPPGPYLYQPAPQPYLSSWQYVAFRTSQPDEPAQQVRAVAAGLDDALPVGEVQSMEAIVAESRSQWTMLAKLMTLLAGFAAVLSAVGLYGVVAFMVRARSRELGIRIALGATAHSVFAHVLRGTTATTVVGLLLGLGGAVGLVRYLESRLFGVAPFDLGVWTLAAVAMATVAFAAAFLPARRATRLDPVETLRAE
ncbi:MAG: ADOP family duplicated permease [Acidobacteriota bacterium]|jgi:predicted permease